MLRSACLAACLLLATAAYAQDGGIRWGNEPREAVEASKKTKRPIMAYVLAGTRDRDDDLERDQNRALNSPRVQRLARRFITLRLSRSQHRDLLKDFGFRESANMELSFITPDGKVIGELSQGGVADADALAQKLVLVLRNYRQQLFDADIHPVLDKAESTPQQIKDALKLVEEFQVTEADRDIVALLGREGLPADIRGACLDLLAALSTKPAVEKLIELVKTGDAKAVKALSACNPLGAEIMLDSLKPDAGQVDYAVYQAVARIAKVKDIKPQKFFEKGKEKLQKEELDRMREIVKKVVRKYREQNDDDR